MTTVDQQQLELLSQIQQKLLSTNNVLILSLTMGLPLPVSWKLGFYNWFISTPLVSIPPAVFILLIALGPVLLLFSLYFLIKLFVKVIKTIIPLFFCLTHREKVEKKIIQLTFPANTTKSAYATEQFYTLLHTLSRQLSFWEVISSRKNEYSLEIVSTKKEGIRYLLAAQPKFIEIISHNLLSFLPGIKIKEVGDYLESLVSDKAKTKSLGLIELKLSSHMALPLETQKALTENDPVAYLTGNMTKLDSEEIISYQILISPVISKIQSQIASEINKIKYRIYKGQTLTEIVEKNDLQKLVSLPGINIFWFLIKGSWKIVSFLIMFVFSLVVAFFDTSGKSVPFYQTTPKKDPQDSLNPYETELVKIVKSKIDQSLFETSIRILVVLNNPETAMTRLNGLLASLGQSSSPYQSLITKHFLFSKQKQRLNKFQLRQLSKNSSLNPNPILSTSEIADLYHFPFTETTKTEDMAKVYSQELPSPLSVKNNSNFDVIFGKNTYDNTNTEIGLTDEDRSRHVYLIGQTGSGKTTVIFHMAKDDIQKGRGVTVIDPHGDLAEDLLTCVPEKRFNDCIYLNPFDIRHPIGINLLELTPGLDEDELEQEKELVCESVVSVFRRLFSKDEKTDSHRIEYILRNTIYTAFTIKGATIFTVYDLLNDPKFRKRMTVLLDDENLKNFWTNEFGKAGSFQAVKMVSGVTAKIGRFLFSPTAKRILEQSNSTINFDEILNSGKILICNLAEGKLGEDTSQLLGTTIIAKLQQAAMRRARMPKTNRKPFYLFVDEFQNFATSSFTKLLSGGRKFGLRLTIAEQSTAQQDDRNIVNVILANTGTVICFRTASPIDEQLMADQFSPYVTTGDIGNLPRYRFYMKMSAIKPEEPFSGETIPMDLDADVDKVERLIETSRKNFAIVYQKPGIKTVKSETKQKNIIQKPTINKGLGTL